ncbi:hypothetical protein Tco_0193429, partial [Tanacetum coccineum]
SSMSDSEDSTVTYTEISSPYEDLSDVGSPGVEGPIFQDPPSPDYVPGPEKPEQAPPSPIYIPFVPEPSPGYIPESDPEEDLEEEDPADYPADRGDARDDEESSDDNDDAEEEHLAPAVPAAVAYSADQTHTLLIASWLGCPSDPRRRHRSSSRKLLRDCVTPPKWVAAEIWVGECYFIDQQHEI